MNIISGLFKIGRAEAKERIARAWLHVAHGGGLKHPREAGPIKGAPGVHEEDAAFIVSAGLLSKWSDVEFYGPGAAAAYARRAERLSQERPEPGTKLAFSAKDAEPIPAKITLRERWRKLREELNKHEKK
jgi:hypothetical protein